MFARQRGLHFGSLRAARVWSISYRKLSLSTHRFVLVGDERDGDVRGAVVGAGRDEHVVGVGRGVAAAAAAAAGRAAQKVAAPGKTTM